VVVSDEAGLVVQMNPAGERIWGYARNEVLGQPASMFSALPEPEATAVIHEVLAALQATGTWRGTFQNRRKDGAIIACEAVINRLEVQGRKLMVAVEQDVTERQRAQEQLQMQARVLASMAEAVLMLDEDGSVLLSNPAAETLLGYARGELLGQPLLAMPDYAPKEFRQALARSLEQAEAHGSAAGDYVARRKDGSLIEVETRTSGISVGGRCYLIVVAQDVTQRKQTEQALRQSEETLRVFLDAIPTPAFLLDRNAAILVSNPALARSLNLPEGNLVGQHVFGLLPPQLGATRRAMFDQILLTRKPIRYEDTRGGRDFLTFESPVLDAAGNVTRVAVFALDISERKQAESALARQEALYRTLFELSPDGILLEDGNGNILDINLALCRAFGYPREALLHQNVRWFVPPEGQSEVEAHLATLRSGQSLEHEVWNVRRSGERCLMRLTEKPLALPNGRQGILVVARDITQSKRAEMTKEVFLSLGVKLSSVRTPIEAARAIYASADQLWQWDAASLSLYYQESDVVEPVLFCDVMDGHRRELVPPFPPDLPTAQRRRVMREGAELILRKESDFSGLDTVRFGDVSRPSASIMYVPMRREGRPVGVLSIQSYTVDAYSQEDLRTLQALADYCAGAVERIRTEQALQQREALNRTIVTTAMDGFFTLDFAADPGGLLAEVNDAYCRLVGYSREELLQMRIADLEAAQGPEDVARHTAKIIATGSDRFETRHRRKDGVEIDVEISVSRLAGTGERMFGFLRDITERKRADAELRAANVALAESEERYRSLVTNLNVGVYRNTPGPDGRFLHANPALARMHGYESVEEFQKVKVADLYQEPGDRKAFLADLLRQGSLVNYEIRLKKHDGTPIFGSVCAAMHRGPDGEVEYVDGVIEDITKRKKAEQTLAEALELNRTLISASTVGIAAYQASGQCVLANEALARISGGTVEQLRQQNFRQLKSWRADGLLAAAEAALKAGQPRRLETSSRTSFGRELAINARFAPFVSRGEQHLLVMVTDETDAQRAQQALRVSEERYRALAESSPDAIFILNREIKVQYVNSAAASLWGRQPEALIGLTQAELFPPEIAQRHCQEVAEVFATGKPVRRDEPLTIPAGNQWLEIRLVPLHGEQGSVSSVMGVCRDITERKRAERQLAEAFDLNQKMIAASTTGIAAYEASGKCVFANKALARIVGGSISAVRESNFRQFTSWQKSGLLQLAEEALSQGRARRGEIYATSQFGRSIWMDCHTIPFVSNGQPHLLLMALDTTERKQAEDALKLQSLVVQNMAEGALLVGSDQTILFANRALETTFGYKPGELIGQQAAVLNAWTPEETARFNAEVIRATDQGGAWSGEYQNRRKDGTLFTSEARVRALDLGGKLHYVSVQQDITERKRAEGALKQAERLQRAILDNIPDPAWLKDSEGRFLACNQAIATFYGRPVKALLGKTVLDCSPAEGPRTASEDQEVMTTRRSVVVEAPLTDAQGRVRWLESIKSPLFNERDEVIGTVGIARDVTERHRLEHQILEISDREQARIGQDIHDGLCQQLVSLAFDANSLQTQLCAQRLPESKKAQRIADCLDQAITETRQLSRGLFPVRLESEGLPSALEELAKAACVRFQIECSFNSQGAAVVENVVVATHLYRIAQEALTNAVRHSRAHKVSICLKAASHQLELSIEDDGKGFSAAKRKKATGMGLHIMAYRARTIAGTLHLGPGPQGGTLVSCCIPAAAVGELSS